MEITRTRQSLGSQLRATLDEMKAKGQIQAWQFIGSEREASRYDIHDGYGRRRSLLPGEVMDWVNCYGYDVRFGKVPKLAKLARL